MRSAGPRAGGLASALLASAWLLAACSVEGDQPAARRPAPEQPVAGNEAPPSGGSSAVAHPAELTIVGDSRVLLGFNNTADITVMLTRNGAPLRGQTIAFDLLGRPQDTSLSTLTAVTRSDGTASTVLTAGERASTFSLRASTKSALAVTFSVAISGAGFGSLLVLAPYDGDRSVVERRVLAYPGLTCDAIERHEDDAATVIAPGEDSASLIALPAAIDYAVLVIGQGEGGAVLAQGCDDGITVQADTALSMEIAFDDEPLVPASALQLTAQLEAGEVAASLAAAIRGAGDTLVRSDALGGNAPVAAEGRFWLDSLDAVLRADDATPAQHTLASALTAARAAMYEAGAGPESELTSLLEINSQGAMFASDQMAMHVRTAMDTLSLQAELEIEGDGAPKVTLTPSRFACAPVVEGGGEPAVDLSMEEPAQSDARFQARTDTLDLRTLTFSPRFGALAAKVLDRVFESVQGGPRAALSELAGCESLSEWLGKQSFADASACKASCVRAACDESLARLLDAAQARLELLDDARPSLSISGVLALDDENGDLIAENMESDELKGEWLPEEGASLPDALMGTVRASVADDAP